MKKKCGNCDKTTLVLFRSNQPKENRRSFFIFHFPIQKPCNRTHWDLQRSSKWQLGIFFPTYPSNVLGALSFPIKSLICRRPGRFNLLLLLGKLFCFTKYSASDGCWPLELLNLPISYWPLLNSMRTLDGGRADPPRLGSSSSSWYGFNILMWKTKWYSVVGNEFTLYSRFLLSSP